jgi:hypothetical protein
VAEITKERYANEIDKGALPERYRDFLFGQENGPCPQCKAPIKEINISVELDEDTGEMELFFECEHCNMMLSIRGSIEEIREYDDTIGPQNLN